MPRRATGWRPFVSWGWKATPRLRRFAAGWASALALGLVRQMSPDGSGRHSNQPAPALGTLRQRRGALAPRSHECVAWGRAEGEWRSDADGLDVVTTVAMLG